MKLPVCEIFYSLQGEGVFAGRPSVFLRLGGCNLSCPGFGVVIEKKSGAIIGCDSIHAVNREHFASGWKNYDDPALLIDDIKRVVPNDKRYDIVLTGGEPTVFYKNPILIKTLEHFLKNDFSITIETNATIEIDFGIYPEYKECLFAMSVKLSNSGESEKRRINKRAIAAIANNTKGSFFKFVLDAHNIEKLGDEIKEVVEGFNNLVYCMPLGESSELLSENDRAVFEFCIKNGYSYSDRTHIRVWGQKGGV